MNKGQMKTDFKAIFAAIYQQNTADVYTYGEIDMSDKVDAASATYEDKANETNIDYPINGTLEGYFDTTVGGDGRKDLMLRYVWTWRVNYDASGAPTINKLGGTYEWDKSHKPTKDLLEHAKINGWVRA